MVLAGLAKLAFLPEGRVLTLEPFRIVVSVFVERISLYQELSDCAPQGAYTPWNGMSPAQW
jgi:hypothetical protein